MFKEGKKRESADKSKFSLIKLFSCVEKKQKKKKRKKGRTRYDCIFHSTKCDHLEVALNSKIPLYTITLKFFFLLREK